MEPEMFPEGIMENIFTKTQLYTFSHIPWDQRTPYLIKLPPNPSSVSIQVNIKTLLIYQDLTRSEKCKFEK